MENKIDVITCMYSLKHDLNKIQEEQYCLELIPKDLFQKAMQNFNNNHNIQEELKNIIKSAIKKHGKYIIFCESKENVIDISNMFYEWLKEFNYKFNMIIIPDNYSKHNLINELNCPYDNNIKLIFTSQDLDINIIKECDGIFITNSNLNPNYISKLFKNIVITLAKQNKEKEQFVLTMYNTIDQYHKDNQMLSEIKNSNDINVINKNTKTIEDLLKIVNQELILSWDDYYETTKLYHQKYGDLNQKINYNKIKREICSWIDSQRKAYLHHKLTQKQIDLLNEIGILLEPATEEKWNHAYQVAKKYYENNNNLFPLYYYKDGGIYLSVWLSKQRKAFQNNELSTTQINMLNEIGMVWTDVDFIWGQNYLIGKEYYNQNGNLSIKNFHKKENIVLANWLNLQRRDYVNNKLTDEQIELLNKIGIDWTVVDDWEANYALANHYYEQNGNLIITDMFVQQNRQLAKWLYKQRIVYNKGALSEERVIKLESIGMLWNQGRYKFLTRRMRLVDKLKLEKMFLEFLSKYAKQNKSNFESYDDVKKINEEFQKKIEYKFGIKTNDK